MSEYRTLTTTDELDALPSETVVLTQFDQAVQITRDARPESEWWHWLLSDPEDTLRVIWEPQP